ncbi:uncharacterized protein LAJ45_00007 [Morchella importuna]|nr:uncharacterized protein LAJ45_00007 [Morchella importuna]KAH8154999.1 hypothetical protein LAJ45_00007 [Morchella importuna]
MIAKPKPMAPYVHLDQSTNAKIARAERANATTISRRALLGVRVLAIALRALQLLGAMGLLLCMMFVRKLDDITGWICRVPPAVAIFHIVYYIYHVACSDRVRTPKSSVSYFLFASVVDLAIISFYAFIAILSYRQHQGVTDGAWGTIFNNDDAASKIFITVFLVACISGALAILSLLVTLYLIRIFRHLASLSADQNPFLVDEKDSAAYTPLGKRWSDSTTATAAPSMPEISKAVPFLTTRNSDLSVRDSAYYTNIPVPSKTARHSLYPATGHLYPAGGPVYDTPADTKKSATATVESSGESMRSVKRGKKTWGNLKAGTMPKRKDSGSSSIYNGAPAPVEERSTSTSLQPESKGDRDWSFSFRKRSGAHDASP